MPLLPSPNRPLIFWLFGTCFLIWLMIILGGATRLTHSGLSIVEWKPITGIIPPLNTEQWQEEFQKYQQFPEYKLLNQGMTLSSFKFIYFMEYAHRLLGRLMGLFFILPLLYFWKRHQLTLFLKKRAMLALILGLAQGVMGWYMVKSGLVKDPAVSHYRLTAHLGLAIALYSLLFWTALEIRAPRRPFTKLEPESLSRLSIACTVALTLTIIYGGLVAGLKAGLIYNTFPFMGTEFLPDECAFYHPLWVNLFENPALVQWIHRWVALSTVGLILYTSWKFYTLSPNRTTRHASLVFAGVSLLQATLGILTLLFHVPVALGTLHQGVAIVLFSIALYLVYATRGQHLANHEN